MLVSSARVVAFLAVLACAACVNRPTYQCADSTDCGAGGVCQPTGACSFEDGSCGSGQRYHESAGGGIAGTCVPDGLDGADAAMVDATPPAIDADIDSTADADIDAGIDAGLAACAHSVCLVGFALADDCECAAQVCSVDDYCCTSSWDTACIKQAEVLCQAQCSGYLALAAGTEVGKQASHVYSFASTLTPTDSVWNTGTDLRNHSIPSWGDLDGDGDADLAFGSIFGQGDPENRGSVYRNDGGNTFGFLGTLPLATNNTSVAWGELNGGAGVELVIGNFGGGSHVMKNVAGTLSDWVSLPMPHNNTQTVNLVDVDGNGHVDVFLANVSDTKDQIFLNQGGGVFDADTAFAMVSRSSSTWVSAWADHNGDHDRDLMVTGLAGSPARLYDNNGGVLTEIWTSTYLDGVTKGAMWGDVNGDGRMDIAFGNDGQPDRILINTGLGGSQRFELYWVSPQSLETWSVDLGDYDGDGDLDLAVADYNGGAHIYRNDGPGKPMADRFVLAWSSPHSGLTGAGVAFGPDQPATSTK